MRGFQMLRCVPATLFVMDVALGLVRPRFSAGTRGYQVLSAQQKGSGPAKSKSLRQRLADGEKAYGPLLMSDSPVVAELISGVGFDFLVIDHEHSPTDVRSGQTLLQAVEGRRRRTEPLVRLPSSNDPTYVKKVLDSMRLPGGLIFPMVEDVETAVNAVRCVESATPSHRHCFACCC